MSASRLRVVSAAVLLVVAVTVAMVWGLQRRLIYFPAGGPVVRAGQAVEGARDVELRTSDGLALGAWYLPAPEAGFTVLVVNGNAGNREVRLPLARVLSDRGLGVLLFDYRGYGGNPGSPSELGLARDVRAAREFLVGPAAVPGDKLIYFGESLGAAVASELATEHPPAGLLLRSPFASLADVAQVHYPWLPVRQLLRERYPVAENVARIDVPTSVVLGNADAIVPPSQSRQVAAASPRLVRLVEVDGAGHNDLELLNGAALVEAVIELARPR